MLARLLVAFKALVTINNNLKKQNKALPRIRDILKDFKPSLLFIGKFLIVYMIGNVLYGIYVEGYGSQPDPLTIWVSNQTASVLKTAGYEAGIVPFSDQPKVSLQQRSEGVINVFEGCNGINIIILFCAFVIAFKGPTKASILFILVGILLIHISNLARIGLLYWVALEQPDYMYFTHKYLFTAVIYGVVFLLWVLWITRFSRQPTPPIETGESLE